MMMSDDVSDFYPTIPESDVNFVDDYIEKYEYFDKLISFQFGNQIFECDDECEIPSEWDELVDAIVIKHIDQWARLYYALSLDYNPLWNVDGIETTTYGSTTDTTQYGARSDTLQYGATTQTNQYGVQKTTTTTEDHVVQTVAGDRTNDSTSYSMAYPDTTRHENAYKSDTLGGSTDTTTAQGYSDEIETDSHTDTIGTTQHTDSKSSTAYTDTRTGASHVDTLERHGNIGVTQTQQLLSSEWEFRKKSFFDDIFKTILMEVGLYYD